MFKFNVLDGLTPLSAFGFKSNDGIDTKGASIWLGITGPAAILVVRDRMGRDQTSDMPSDWSSMSQCIEGGAPRRGASAERRMLAGKWRAPALARQIERDA